MAILVTPPVVSATPVATATPLATTLAVPTAHVEVSTDVSLLNQLQHVDPLWFSVIAGSLLIPALHQAIKGLVTRLHDPKHRLSNYVVAGLLNLLFGFAVELQNSGVLSNLHNPALAGVLASTLSFFCGQQVYGFFVKTNEQLKATSELPVVLNP